MVEWKPQVGDIVCDCRYLHLRIVRIDPDDPDEVELEDGSHHSLAYCCEPPDHEQPHPVGSRLTQHHSGTELTTVVGYEAMLAFLDGYYQRTKSEEIGNLLGGLAIADDGRPMDSAAWDDWLAAVAEALKRDANE